MVETWRDSWFEEGSRLRVEPTPSRIARVFVERIELVTPDTTRSVAEALTRSDWATIDRDRRFLEPILQRIEPGNHDRAQQAERLLRRAEKSIAAKQCG